MFLKYSLLSLLLTSGALTMAADEKEPVNSDESKVPAYTLPDVLTANDGKKIATKEDWQNTRRAEVLEIFKREVYGRSAGKPEQLEFKKVSEKKDALDGTATAKEIDIIVKKGEKNITIRLNLIVPNKRERPAATFLLIDNRPPENIDITRAKKSPFWPAEAIVARGYAAAAFHNADVALDTKESFSSGIFALLGEPEENRAPDAWGALGAWAWGASRVMDYFETDSDIDAKRVAVIGHSRGGKTALWCGAQDERFALVISNESGCGGAALGKRWFGETNERINQGFPFWFNGNFKKYNRKESEMAFDQHELIALMAPRPVYVASAEEDRWADPKGEYLGLYHAGPVYELFGFKNLPSIEPPAVNTPVYGDRMGYHIRPGKHDLIEYDWERFMDFADKVWK